MEEFYFKSILDSSFGYWQLSNKNTLYTNFLGNALVFGYAPPRKGRRAYGVRLKSNVTFKNVYINLVL